MAGVRALKHYRKVNRTAQDVAALFSAGREDSPALVTKLIEENKKLVHRVRELDELACRAEAEQILNESRLESGNRPPAPMIIAKVFDNRDTNSLKHLALALIAYANVVALLASRDNDTARLVFARSTDAPGDMNALMRKACEMLEGRGGGKPDLAQGGGKNVDNLAQVIDAAILDLKGRNSGT